MGSGRRRRDRHEDLKDTQRIGFRTCARKRKMKSSEASRIAARFGQRKYRCPYCDHWHLTKQRGSNESEV